MSCMGCRGMSETSDELASFSRNTCGTCKKVYESSCMNCSSGDKDVIEPGELPGDAENNGDAAIEEHKVEKPHIKSPKPPKSKKSKKKKQKSERHLDASQQHQKNLERRRRESRKSQSKSAGSNADLFDAIRDHVVRSASPSPKSRRTSSKKSFVTWTELDSYNLDEPSMDDSSTPQKFKNKRLSLQSQDPPSLPRLQKRSSMVTMRKSKRPNTPTTQVIRKHAEKRSSTPPPLLINRHSDKGSSTPPIFKKHGDKSKRRKERRLSLDGLDDGRSRHRGSRRTSNKSKPDRAKSTSPKSGKPKKKGTGKSRTLEAPLERPQSPAAKDSDTPKTAPVPERGSKSFLGGRFSKRNTIDEGEELPTKPQTEHRVKIKKQKKTRRRSSSTSDIKRRTRHSKSVGDADDSLFIINERNSDSSTNNKENKKSRKSKSKHRSSKHRKSRKRSGSGPNAEDRRNSSDLFDSILETVSSSASSRVGSISSDVSAASSTRNSLDHQQLQAQLEKYEKQNRRKSRKDKKERKHHSSDPELLRANIEYDGDTGSPPTTSPLSEPLPSATNHRSRSRAVHGKDSDEDSDRVSNRERRNAEHRDTEEKSFNPPSNHVPVDPTTDELPAWTVAAVSPELMSAQLGKRKKKKKKYADSEEKEANHHSPNKPKDHKKAKHKSSKNEKNFEALIIGPKKKRKEKKKAKKDREERERAAREKYKRERNERIIKRARTERQEIETRLQGRQDLNSRLQSIITEQSELRVVLRNVTVDENHPTSFHDEEDFVYHSSDEALYSAVKEHEDLRRRLSEDRQDTPTLKRIHKLEELHQQTQYLKQMLKKTKIMPYGIEELHITDPELSKKLMDIIHDLQDNDNKTADEWEEILMDNLLCVVTFGISLTDFSNSNKMDEFDKVVDFLIALGNTVPQVIFHTLGSQTESVSAIYSVLSSQGSDDIPHERNLSRIKLLCSILQHCTPGVLRVSSLEKLADQLIAMLSIEEAYELTLKSLLFAHKHFLDQPYVVVQLLQHENHEIYAQSIVKIIIEGEEDLLGAATDIVETAFASGNRKLFNTDKIITVVNSITDHLAQYPAGRTIHTHCLNCLTTIIRWSKYKRHIEKTPNTLSALTNCLKDARERKDARRVQLVEQLLEDVFEVDPDDFVDSESSSDSYMGGREP